MSEIWHFLCSDACRPAANMAIDEALLERAGRQRAPILRSYGWTEPAATFGYFQRYAEVESWTRLRPLIRRPTGGGLVPHDADWTYSMVFPATHGWYRLRAIESYRRIHDWICRAFRDMGVATSLAPTAVKEIPGQCFAGAEQFDLVFTGRKIAGAAQRRNRQGLLIQGSIQPAGLSVGRCDWEQAMRRCVSWPAGVEWELIGLDPMLGERANLLEFEKYSNSKYNQRR